MASRRLDRPRRGEGRVIAGVCAGVAQHYGWSTTLVRVVFLLGAFVGAGELAYLILWVVMPTRR